MSPGEKIKHDLLRNYVDNLINSVVRKKWPGVFPGILSLAKGEKMNNYKAIATGRGDYAVVFPGLILQTGMTLLGAECLAESMNKDLESVSYDELLATGGMVIQSAIGVPAVHSLLDDLFSAMGGS